MALPVNARKPVAGIDRADERPRYDITHLALLHDEARETAMLANLLGRVPYAACALAVAALLLTMSAHGTMPIAETAIWLLLILLGAGAMLRCYAHAIGHPFERGSLREFAYDLNAICICTGFIWGAGGLLALAPDSAPWTTTAWALAIPVIFSVLLRTREISLGLLAPAALLFAFAAVLRPLPEGIWTAAFVLIASVAVAGAIFWMERLFAPPSARGRIAGAPSV